jgi:AmmeMemoRadiSam system protein B
MLVFASICPHPPIIIPSIGGKEVNKATKTIAAMEKLANDFALSKPDTIILASPHGPVRGDRMSIVSSKDLEGNFAQFGDHQTTFSFENDLLLAEEIESAATRNDIPAGLIDAPRLDHGTLVPLYFLARRHKNVRLLPLAFSFLDLQTHYKFGQAVGETIKKSDKGIAFVASGDLSHRVTPDAPAGYSPRGREFDEILIAALKKNDVEGILNLDPGFVEEAGECGLRSIIILLGALSRSKYNFEVLSYEAPFGVGYLVAQANLK